MISNSLPPSTAAGTVSPPGLETFQQAAQQSEWLHVSQDGTEWQVKAAGTTPSQRSVAWVEPHADTTTAFVAALGQSFSRGIQSAVAHELGLQPAPGRPLAGRTVLQAIDMAQTSQTAMQGVDFLTRLNVSAAHGSAAFVDACRLVGRDPAGISQEQRALLDARMDQRFGAAQAEKQGPVSDPVAQDWLLQELRALDS